MAHIHLAPVNPPLGVNPNYCVGKQTTLVMKEKVFSLSGDTFHITDEAGLEVVQCRGTTFSLSDRKEFMDTRGNPLFSLRNKLIAIHKTFYAEEAGTGRILFEIKGKFSIGKSKMVATFVNASTQQPVELLVKGDWLDRSATITMGGMVVAQISRSVFNMRELIGGQQSVSISIGARGFEKDRAERP
ncbi:hypothetical protein HYALB_00004727 [Hymenoscyphus albidus]|uniref:Uncharacterized protein n=1 Tax=Hymenoscyphus albidus TaxID=595503 RepID=A0A9N9LV36_9HELO|nr:hypothetical protein HYALB_00004727 [Hymenoscyphus albidus]